LHEVEKGMARTLFQATASDSSHPSPTYVTRNEMDQRFNRIKLLIIGMSQAPPANMAMKEDINNIVTALNSVSTSNLTSTIEGVRKEVTEIKQSNTAWMDGQME
jgi:hypothetical protein